MNAGGSYIGLCAPTGPDLASPQSRQTRSLSCDPTTYTFPAQDAVCIATGSHVLWGSSFATSVQALAQRDVPGLLYVLSAASSCVPLSFALTVCCWLRVVLWRGLTRMVAEPPSAGRRCHLVYPARRHKPHPLPPCRTWPQCRRPRAPSSGRPSWTIRPRAAIRSSRCSRRLRLHLLLRWQARIANHLAPARCSYLAV